MLIICVLFILFGYIISKLSMILDMSVPINTNIGWIIKTNNTWYII